MGGDLLWIFCLLLQSLNDDLLWLELTPSKITSFERLLIVPEKSAPNLKFALTPWLFVGKEEYGEIWSNTEFGSMFARVFEVQAHSQGTLRWNEDQWEGAWEEKWPKEYFPNITFHLYPVTENNTMVFLNGTLHYGGKIISVSAKGGTTFDPRKIVEYERKRGGAFAKKNQRKNDSHRYDDDCDPRLDEISLRRCLIQHQAWVREGRMPYKEEIEVIENWRVLDSMLHFIVTRVQNAEHPLDILDALVYLIRQWILLNEKRSLMTVEDADLLIFYVERAKKTEIPGRQKIAAILGELERIYISKIAFEGEYDDDFSLRDIRTLDLSTRAVLRFLEKALYQVKLQAHRLLTFRY